ncbi:hypothetical protein V6Z11_D04G044500 [Gossypium hirsutum]
MFHQKKNKNIIFISTSIMAHFKFFKVAKYKITQPDILTPPAIKEKQLYLPNTILSNLLARPSLLGITFFNVYQLKCFVYAHYLQQNVGNQYFKKKLYLHAMQAAGHPFFPQLQFLVERPLLNHDGPCLANKTCNQ